MAPVIVSLLCIGCALVCMIAARRMAAARNRSQKAWMWWAVLFGPIPIAVLAVLPRRKSRVVRA